MDLKDWFDVRNPQHIKAYIHLRNTTMWPVGFITLDRKLGPMWQAELIGMLAEAYIVDCIKANEELGP